MYKHILLPIDLGEDSSWEKALPVAVNMCKTNGAQLSIMTVVPDFGMTIVGQYFPEGYEKEVANKVLGQLHEFVKKNVPDDIQVKHIVGEGTVYEVVLKMAKQIESDLIIMASHRPELKD